MKKGKLQHSLAELHKIKNQIRVELNQVRPTREQIYPDRSPNFSKRIFREKIANTSLLGRDRSASLLAKESSKKVYPKDSIVNADLNKNTERRHYGYKFADKVELSLSTRKKSSSYLHPKPQAQEKEGKSVHRYMNNTSLQGIGLREKERSKLGKRIIHSYHIYKEDLI